MHQPAGPLHPTPAPRSAGKCWKLAASVGGSPQAQPCVRHPCRRIGLRTVELVQDTIVTNTGDDLGTTFYFKVNGLPIYAKGANVIPTDILESRATPARLRHLVAAAKAANMNMLRVWGGGRYLGDAFYDGALRKSMGKRPGRQQGRRALL